MSRRCSPDVHRPPSDVRETVEQLEHFFLSSVFFLHRDARCIGWKGPGAAERLIEEAARKRKKKS